MFNRAAVFLLVPASMVSAAAEAPPEKALKYHEALLKRPHNGELFDRFYGAWLDEQPVESLGAFLTSRAESDGGHGWTVLGLYQLRRGQEEAALGSLAKAIEAMPEDSALWMDRARLRLRRMEFAAARGDLAKAQGRGDETLALEAGKLTGKSWLKEGKPEEAIKAWDALLAAHAGDEDLLEDLVETAASEGETAQALVYSEKLIAASKDPYQKTLRGLRRGDLLVQSGRSDEAVAAYESVLADVGESSWLEREVLAQIDKVFRKQDRVTDLVAELTKLADANPRRLLIHRQLAKLQAAQGDAEGAITRFREVLKRSPGDRELREEFVRLLTDGERFEDASTELEKLIELAPAESGLYLQLASLRSRQNKPEAVLGALNKAHELMGSDENACIRIAGLMFQFGQGGAGEALLKKLSEVPTASPMVTETLAAHYGRTNRKAEAIDLLRKVAAVDDVDVVIRAAGSISALGESGLAFELLGTRAAKFSNDPHFLAALVQGALAAGKPGEAVSQAVKLVRSAKQTSELAEGVSLAGRVIAAADKVEEWRKTLAGQATTTPGETCLLANLHEMQGDTVAVSKLLAPATDPLVVHFHAALLDRRGEFDDAIAVLTRLADTDEGRKAAYFKDLSELQQRAGKTADAIATVERWKQSAPGDKVAWITASRLLRESGKAEEAVKMTRQAVARFEGDGDLAASLASLHDESGQWAEAEAIYWRLYDGSEAPADQARWASQLAQLAMKTGRTDELEEKFRERSRNNRRSLGPILALAELARLTDNEEKRRDLLLEAVRIQPKDVDLRLQIATLEEQSGNPERVLAVLEEALPYDNANRVRSALAQAYLRFGQTVKGLRELRALSGKKAGDPRAAEQNAATLADAKMFDEGIQLLREELPDGGDWRSKYLLALLQEEDGRESEALPAFIQLLQSQEEIATLSKPAAGPAGGFDQYPESIRKLVEFIYSNRLAYYHKSERSRSYQQNASGAGNLAGSFWLPTTVSAVRGYALAHILKLAKRDGTKALDPALVALIHAAGVTNLEFVADVMSQSSDDSEGYAKLIAKYPEEPGLFELVTMYSSSNLEVPALRKILGQPERLSPLARFNGWIEVATKEKSDDSAWTSALTSARAALEVDDVRMRQAVGYRILGLLNGEEGGKSDIPASRLAEFKKLALDALVMKSGTDPNEMRLRLSALALAGTTDQLIEGINLAVKEFRKLPPASQAASSMSGRFIGMSNGNAPGFALPSLSPSLLRSIPTHVFYLFKFPNGADEDEVSDSGSNGLPLADALKRSASFESPALRAWLTMKSGDAAAIAKALAVEAPKEEAADFAMLRAIQALQEKKAALAFETVNQVRLNGVADRTVMAMLNNSLLAIAGELTAEEKAKLAPELEAIFLQVRQAYGPQRATEVAGRATQLGLTELAKRLQPAASTNRPGRNSGGGAAFAGSRSSSSTSGQNGSVDRLKKFVADKKFERAALEALQILRKPQSSPFGSSDDEELPKILGKEGSEELIKLVEPGDSKSLVKRLEYAAVCSRFGKPELALKILEALHAERPDDAVVSCRLAFLLPPERAEERNTLMSAGALAADFVDEAAKAAERVIESSGARDKRGNEFMEGVAVWLESADPQVLAKANLTWVGYYAKYYYENSPGGNLLQANSGKRTSGDANEDSRRTAKRLAQSMLRHPHLCEAGYRLLAAAKCWSIPDEELDSHARKAVANAVRMSKDDESDDSSSPFTLRRQQSGSSRGDDLDEFTPMLRLMYRLEVASSPEVVFPASYLDELRTIDPKTGEVLAGVVSLKTVDQLRKFWDSVIAKESSANELLQLGLVRRAGSLPGSAAFFLERLAKLKPAAMASENAYGPYNAQALLVRAALKSAAATPSNELRESLCKAIGRAVFGDKIDWEKPADSRLAYNSINMIEMILRGQHLSALEVVRLVGTFHRLKLPVGESTSYLADYLENQPGFASASDAEIALELIGCLSDVETWSPLSVWTVETNQVNANTWDFIVKDEQIASSFLDSSSFPTSDLIKRLVNRKTERFGALLFASALTESSKERESMVAQAFTESAAAVAKLSPERLAEFGPVLAGLSSETIGKLPPVLQERMKGASDKRRADLLKAADAYLGTAANQRYSSGFDFDDDLMEQLLRLDVIKAADVFIEGNRRFTASLGNGSSVAYNGYQGMMVNRRDETLFRLFDADSPLSADGVMALKFLARVSTSPGGGQFSFGPRFEKEGSGVIAKAGRAVRKLATADKSREKMHDIRRDLEFAATLPAEIRGDALVSVVCMKFDEIGGVGDNFAPEERRKADGWKDSLKGDFRCVDIIFGVIGWKGDNAEGHKLTATALAAICADPAVHDYAKQAMAFRSIARAPGLLDEPGISSVLVGLYADYCAADRSAVNGWAPTLVGAAAQSSGSDSAALAKRIHEAFWKNAQASKLGGHVNIPQSLITPLVMLAARAGDDATQKRLLAQAKGSVTGNLQSLTGLILAGQNDIAKSLLPAPGALYPGLGLDSKYSRELEERLKPFLDTLEPEQALRFEAQMLTIDPATGPSAPKEAMPDRALRLAGLYKLHPPKDRLIQAEVLSHISSGSQLAALSLADELALWAKDCDFKACIGEWASGASVRPGGFARYFYSGLEKQVMEAAALTEMLKGGSPILERFATTLVEEPLVRKSPDNTYPSRGRTTFVVRTVIQEFNDRAAFWIWLAISRDETSGFAKALKSFEDLVLTSEARFEFADSDINSTLAICQFLSHWTDQPQRFDELCARMKTRQNLGKGFPRRDGLAPLARAASTFGAWKSGYAKDVREKGLARIFAHPGFAPLVSHDGGWFERLDDVVPPEQLDAIASQPSEAVIPVVRTGLAEYLGKRRAAANKPDEAISAFKKALAACPVTPDWKDIRSAVKVELAEVLLAQKRQDEARELIGAMAGAEVGDWIKGRYRKVAATLGLADATAAPPKP